MNADIKHVEVSDTISIDIKELVRLEGFVRSRKKGRRFVRKQGDSLYREEDKWYRLRQLVDYAHKRYQKRIVDPETGVVIRDDYELLHNHRGRGSAKIKIR